MSFTRWRCNWCCIDSHRNFQLVWKVIFLLSQNWMICIPVFRSVSSDARRLTCSSWTDKNDFLYYLEKESRVYGSSGGRLNLSSKQNDPVLSSFCVTAFPRMIFAFFVACCGVFLLSEDNILRIKDAPHSFRSGRHVVSPTNPQTVDARMQQKTSNPYWMCLILPQLLHGRETKLLT